MSNYLIMTDGGKPFYKFYLAESIPQLEQKLKDAQAVGRKVSGVFLIDVDVKVDDGGGDEEST